MLPLRDHLPTRTVPFVNYTLIAANVVVFLMQLSGTLGPGMGEQWMLHPAVLWVDPVYGIECVFSSMFMHEGLAHIGFNMLFLWIFGDNVEDAMGHFRYVAFYLIGGVCAAGAQVLAAPTSMVPMLGASGAIASVLAAYMFLYPRSPITVLVFVFLMEFPAWVVLGLWFLGQLAITLAGQGGGGGGVAVMAHVGGFVSGALLYRLFLLGRPRLDEYRRHDQWLRRRPARRDDYS